MPLERAEYWRLSSFYLFYFALLGAIVPFLGLFFKSLGYDELAIGTLMAVLMGTRIVSPNFWGWLADRSGRRLGIIRLGALLTLLVFSLAFWAQSFWHWLLLMCGFSFFWNAVLPQFEALTMQALGANRHSYSWVRLWGSIGFIVAVVGLGWVFDRIDIGWLPTVLWALMLFVWLASLWIHSDDSQPQSNETTEPLLALIKRPEVLSFFGVCLLIQLSHGPYYSFYSLYMSEQGYDKMQIGLLWALGVVAEVLLFLLIPRLLRWSGPRLMVMVGMLITALRWLLIALLPDQLWAVLFAQVLHAVSFGALHAAGIALVHHYFPAASQGQGQALYSSLGFGVGGALGAYISGWIWGQYDGGVMFLFAAVAAVLGFVLAWRGIKADC